MHLLTQPPNLVPLGLISQVWNQIWGLQNLPYNYIEWHFPETFLVPDVCIIENQKHMDNSEFVMISNIFGRLKLFLN